MAERGGAVIPVAGTSAEVIIGGDGGVVRTGSGAFLRLAVAPETLAEEGVQQQLALAVAGRERQEAEQAWPAVRRSVTLIGRGPLTERLAIALADCGARVIRHDTSTGVSKNVDEPAGLVMAIAESPAERAGWAALDELAGQGIAWLRGYREGTVCFVDPISVERTDPGSQQVARRRRAASLVPDELRIWQRSSQQYAELSQAASTLMVARVLGVALAWARSAPELDGYRRTLWILRGHTVSEHLVLGYDPPHQPC